MPKSMTNKIDPRVYELADEGLLALIEKAKVSALSPEEYALYLAEMKIIGDSNAPEMYGYHRGMKEGIQSMVRLLFESGMTVSEISKRLQMTEEQVRENLA